MLLTQKRQKAKKYFLKTESIVLYLKYVKGAENQTGNK